MEDIFQEMEKEKEKVKEREKEMYGKMENEWRPPK